MPYLWAKFYTVKKLLLVLPVCLLLAACSQTQRSQQQIVVPAGPAKAEWAEKQADLGNIPQGTPVTHEFTVNNTGGEPLTIRDAKITCHCITTDWQRDPIAPGKSGWVKVTFDAETAGEFYRFVPVSTSVDSVGQGTALIVKGTVIAKKDSGN